VDPEWDPKAKYPRNEVERDISTYASMSLDFILSHSPYGSGIVPLTLRASLHSLSACVTNFVLLDS
jgi:hypothetical protein